MTSLKRLTLALLLLTLAQSLAVRMRFLSLTGAIRATAARPIGHHFPMTMRRVARGYNNRP